MTPRRPTAGRGPGPLQQQRSSATRDTVIATAVGLLRQGGPSAVTAAALSEGSGVSWGGIQHQFGNKDAVVEAALEWLMADLGSQWREPVAAGGDVDTRVEELVARVWQVVQHPSYAPLVALLRDRAGRRTTTDPALRHLQQAARATTGTLFADLDLEPATLDAVHAFCFAALGGIAEQQSLTPAGSAPDDELLGLVRAGVRAALTGER